MGRFGLEARARELAARRRAQQRFGQRGLGRTGLGRAPQGPPGCDAVWGRRRREGEPRRGHARPTRLRAHARTGEEEGTRGHG
jgi:hypothetical protein